MILLSRAQDVILVALPTSQLLCSVFPLEILLV
jgi:hypothetical protein